MTYQVWWLQGNHERPVSPSTLTLEQAETLQHRLYAIRDMRFDDRIAYDADFEIR